MLLIAWLEQKELAVILGHGFELAPFRDNRNSVIEPVDVINLPTYLSREGS